MPWGEETAFGRGIILLDHIEHAYGLNHLDRGQSTGDRLVQFRDGSLLKPTWGGFLFIMVGDAGSLGGCH